MKKHYSSVISTLFGKFASKEFSTPVQKIINHGYVKLMGLDMTDFKNPNAYATLNKPLHEAYKLNVKLRKTIKL